MKFTTSLLTLALALNTALAWEIDYKRERLDSARFDRDPDVACQNFDRKRERVAAPITWRPENGFTKCCVTVYENSNCERRRGKEEEFCRKGTYDLSFDLDSYSVDCRRRN
jgi:hypothetical protein